MDTLKKSSLAAKRKKATGLSSSAEAPKDASPEALIRAMGRHYMMLDALRRRGGGWTKICVCNFQRPLGLRRCEVTPERVVPVVERALEEGPHASARRDHRTRRRKAIRLQAMAIRPIESQIRTSPQRPPAAETFHTQTDAQR
jgi:hypothetical protein